MVVVVVVCGVCVVVMVAVVFPMMAHAEDRIPDGPVPAQSSRLPANPLRRHLSRTRRVPPPSSSRRGLSTPIHRHLYRCGGRNVPPRRCPGSGPSSPSKFSHQACFNGVPLESTWRSFPQQCRLWRASVG